MKATLRTLQQALERFYELEGAPDVSQFIRTGDPESRETLLLREAEGELEVALVLPPLDEKTELEAAPTDAWLQVVEGVSHFVYVAERARTGLPATLLELELQAEVDKFVLLTFATSRIVDPRERLELHESLYAKVRFLHPPDSELGRRYRMANDLAARFLSRLFDKQNALATLRRFYRAGQAEKIHLARAA